MKLKKCDKCNKDITICNYEKHYKVCGEQKNKPQTHITKTLKQIDDKYQCPNCLKLYSKSGIGTHIWRNHTEEGKLFETKINYKGRVAWNKGLTKETDERVKRNGDSFSANVKSGKINLKGRIISEKQKNKMSKTIKQKVKDGTWHYSFSKTRTHEYKGVKLHGSWELQYAKYLDENNIKWERPKEKFPYMFENKNSSYTPDFYLTETDEYIEIKGYETDKDRAKWKYFPHKLIVLKKKELFELNIITNKQFKGLE